MTLGETMNRKWVALGLVLVLGVVGAVRGPEWWAKAWEKWRGNKCQVLAGSVPADQPLPPIRISAAANPDLSGYKTAALRNATDAVDRARRIPSDIGTLRSVVTAPSEKEQGPDLDAVNLFGLVDGEPLLRFSRIYRGSRVAPGVMTRIDTRAGRPSWARWYRDDELMATSTPTSLVTVQRAPKALAPQVASVGPDTGDMQWCKSLGADYLDYYGGEGSDIAAGDGAVFAVHSERQANAEQAPTLMAMDPATGKDRWKKRIAGFTAGGAVDVFGKSVLVTQWAFDSRGSKASGRLKADPVRAFSTADGADEWEYRGPDATGWANKVIGVRDGIVLVHSRQTSSARSVEPGAEGQYTRNWLVGLGPDGKERWRQDLSNRVQAHLYDGVMVAGSTVLTFETQDSVQGLPQTVVARDVASGKTRWTKHLPADQDLDRNPSALAVVGNNLLVRQGLQKLVAVGLATGAIRTLMTQVDLVTGFAIAAAGKSLVIEVGGVFLTFDR
ncbi:PQQ-binding-like beta-propeller repeat protein [Kribbella sp. NPDC059898]|uniref:outer membrane protein assembly factor BamB family protein n=1 Tax=Kribbella sp. NPDC059898 TaxID=3346995 RepID=UPI00364E980D